MDPQKFSVVHGWNEGLWEVGKMDSLQKVSKKCPSHSKKGTSIGHFSTFFVNKSCIWGCTHPITSHIFVGHKLPRRFFFHSFSTQVTSLHGEVATCISCTGFTYGWHINLGSTGQRVQTFWYEILDGDMGALAGDWVDCRWVWLDGLWLSGRL